MQYKVGRYPLPANIHLTQVCKGLYSNRAVANYTRRSSFGSSRQARTGRNANQRRRSEIRWFGGRPVNSCDLNCLVRYCGGLPVVSGRRRWPRQFAPPVFWSV